MKFIDWFAGIGGFRRGMELAGHECVGFCEFDKYAVMSYTAMHLCTDEQLTYLATLPFRERQKEILKEEYRNGEWYANDVRTVDARNIPDADCWCFGFPCQDISVAGKQLGFTGNRSSLFFRVMYLVGQLEEEKRPTHLFIENVKNLLSVNGGWDFAKLLSELDKNGYDAEWQVLNSKYFGVPQNRERCFIIGHLRGRSRTEVFPVEGADGEDSFHRINQVGHLGGKNRDNPQRFRVYEDGISPSLHTMQGGGLEPCVIEKIGDRPQWHTESGCIVVGNTNPSGNGMNGNCYYSEGINPTLTCNKNEGNRVAIPVLTPDRAKKRQNGRRFKEDGEEAFTLTSQDRHGVAVQVNPKLIGGIGERNFGNNWHPGNRVYDSEAIGATLTAQPCGRTAGHNAMYAVKVDQAKTVGYDATSKCGGGGVTETARTLNARDYKGLSGGNQMMTVAAMMIRTKEDD